MPTVELEVSGSVSANYFIGDGSRLKNVSIDNVSGNLGVAKGGTGLSIVPSGAILVGAGTGALNAVPLFSQGALLIGTGTNVPTQGFLTATTGLRVINGAGTIQIDMPKPSGVITSNVFSGNDGISSVTLDDWGRVTAIATRNLDNRYYTQANSDARYLTSAGGMMTGALVFNVASVDITTFSNADFTIVPSGSGKVGIGTSTPQQLLDVAGGIKIGTTTENVPGSIKYDAGRFLGYDGISWKYLDLQQSIEGTFNATAFVGDGNGLTNLNPNAFLSTIPVIRGGTGTTNFTAKGVVFGNSTGGLKATSALGSGQIIIGSNGDPVVGSITPGAGIDITITTGSVVVSHGGTSTVNSLVVTSDISISALNFDQFGHVLQVATRSLDERYYTKNQVDSKILFSQGNTMTGALVFSGVTMDITAAPNEHIAIVPSGSGMVAIGTTIPVGLLSIGGANNGLPGQTGGVQLYLGGTRDHGVNAGGKKIHVADYDNDGTTIYPFYAEDEDGQIDFYIKNRASDRAPSVYTPGNVFVGIDANDLVPSGTVSAKYFKGDGSQLSNVNISTLTGQVGVPYGGTGASIFNNGGVLIGSGTSPVVSTAVLGNGQLLIGKGTGAPALATLTAGTGVAITNGAGSITIAHDDTSSVANVVGASTVRLLNGLTFDTYGHVLSTTTTDLTAGTGINVSAGSGTVTVTHGATGSGAGWSIAGWGGVVMNAITADQFGHITTANTVDLDNRYYTQALSNANFVNVSGGDTMTGPFGIAGNVSV
ncbi:hypothetical protein EBR96_07205, partial [bacterium]|nr:hypothetical protein [bacterium]